LFHLPGTSAPGFYIRRYAAESALIVLHILSDQVVFRHTLEAAPFQNGLQTAFFRKL
jgi:hypothetical protein